MKYCKLCKVVYWFTFSNVFACLENERHMYIEYSGNIVPELV